MADVRERSACEVLPVNCRRQEASRRRTAPLGRARTGDSPLEQDQRPGRLSMTWLAPWRRRPRASDIEEELRAHLVFAAEDRLVEGETPEIARRRAREELGHVPLLREDMWAVWGCPWLEDMWKD